MNIIIRRRPFYHLWEVFNILRQVGPKVVRYIGHMMSYKVTAADPFKTNMVAHWPVSSAQRSVQQFLSAPGEL